MTNLVAAIVLIASWERFDDAGHLAANGQPFNPSAMTCATRRWPLGAILRVEDVHNHSAVTVRVTDRTARKYANRIDLSPAAFEKLNGLALGLCKVTVTPLTTNSQSRPAAVRTLLAR